MSSGLATADAVLISGAERAVLRTTEHLLATQDPHGYWQVPLTADSTLESDYVLLQLWLYPPQNGVWRPPTQPLIDNAVRSILARQLPDGGFNIYPDGPSVLNATVKAYVALKLGGLDVNDARLARARECILEAGGLQAANSYVKINLSLFGLYPSEDTPAIPPEIMLAGRFIYEMSAWTRAIVVPLSIVRTLGRGRPAPAGFTIEELYRPDIARTSAQTADLVSWRNFFLRGDRALKFWDKHAVGGLRQRAVRKAEQWILSRTRYSDGLAAIYPSILYSIMALDILGYKPDHPDRAEVQRAFDRLMTDRGESLRFQPCYSAVWDTAIAAYALAESPGAPETSLRRAADWLLSKEVRRKGDWSVKRPNTPPSGWFFQYANEFYPDVDDTAMVLLALSRCRGASELEQQASVRRALRWMTDMQSKDGGWAAFDVDNNWKALQAVPFADHNAMLDPTVPDITGRVLESYAALNESSPAVRRGIDFLIKNQEQDGSWWGRWGVDYIYGTCFALRGLAASGVSDREAYVLRAGEWMRAIQNSDGGWGESCASYDHHTYIPAPSTPSQTAWAILGLLAGGDTTSISVRKGVEYLLETQRHEGTWDETLATGTGFPQVFYLCFHLYRNAFPLLALNAYRKIGAASSET
jgi:squalene-hopene/tetraprenyl-beta-curcumene cyclase